MDYINLTDQDITLFNFALKSCSSYDFTDYSEKSLKRRIAKILVDYKIDLITLIKKIKEDKVFVEEIVKEITVNTTELFRDPTIWHSLRYRILPRYENKKVINIWHAGCSTGQEVYSMMILLKELNLFDKAKIYASDINQDVIDKAIAGEYKYRFNIGYLDNFDKVIKQNPFNFEEYNDVPYSNYFTIDKNKDILKMHDFLREKPIYKKHDLVRDSNLFYVKFDIILCRNVVIYFNYKLQNKVFSFFYDNLYDEGHLLLGKQETIRGAVANNFDKGSNSYIKRGKFYF